MEGIFPNNQKNRQTVFPIFVQISTELTIFQEFSSDFAPILMHFLGVTQKTLENVELA